MSGFALSQRQATSKVSTDIFVRFPLASSAGKSAYTAGLLPPAAELRKNLVYQLAAQNNLKLTIITITPTPRFIGVVWRCTDDDELNVNPPTPCQ